MKKLNLKGLFIVLFCAIAAPSLLFAQTVIDEQLNFTTVKTYATDKNVVVLDFTLTKSDGNSDVLKTLIIQKLDAVSNTKFKKAVLWEDDTYEGFDGFTLDKKIGEFVLNGSLWQLKDLTVTIPKEGKRFFITVDIDDTVSTEEDVRFYIPTYYDASGDGMYDENIDQGLFFDNSNEYSVEINQKNQLNIRTSTRDILPPRVAPTNIFKNPVYTTDNKYTLKFVGEDRLNSGIVQAQVSFTKKGSEAIYNDATLKNTDNGVYNYEYVLDNIEYNSEYDVKLFAKDGIGNYIFTEAYTVIFKEKQVIVIEVPDEPVVESNVSFEKSRLFVNRDLAIRAPFEDTDIHAKVLLLDEAGKPISGKLVTVHADRPGKQHQLTLMTGEDGTALWIINSTVNSTFTFYAEVDGKQLAQKPTIKFIDTRLGGELIKARNSKAVYLLKDDKRYVFPNQAIYKSYYENFDSVKEITPEQMASYQLGGNIRYRPGSLIKIPSIPKVYRVNEEGVLNWIESESKAREMYGPTWASLVHDLADSYFVDYSIGNSVE